MDAFLLAIGYWNFFGSVIMLCFLNENFGQNILNNWTKIFDEKFLLNYWVKLWIFWAAGLNIFFGLINIMSVKWGYPELKIFLVYSDLIAYFIFISLAFWGLISKRMGTGVYAVFVIFTFWLLWGVYVLI